MKTSGSVRFNDSGVAIFVSLIILFIITIAGVSIIVVASKDKVSSANVSEIRTVAFAANAALSAYESQCKLQPAVVRGILNKYKTDASYKWLLVSDSQDAKSEKKVSLGTDGYSYSAMISAFDKANRIMQVTGTGYGRSNSKKTITAIYKLTGIDTSVTPGGKSNYGLYCAGNGKNFDTKMNIYGNVYVGQSFAFNGSGGMHVFGSLKTGYNPSLLSIINGAVTVDSAVYIGSMLSVKAAFTCNSVVGVEGNVAGDKTFTIGGDLWMNDTNVVTSTVMSGKTLHHSGHVDMSKVTNGIQDNKKATISGIADIVGLSDKNDSAWTFLKAAELIAMGKSLTSGSITASDLQTFYNTCPAANKYNGYAVMSPPSWGFYSVNPGTGSFSGKMIILVNKGMQVNGNFPDMTSDSRILIYAYSNSNISDFGGFYNSSFNGMIFAVDNPIIILGYSGKTFSLNGAIHYASKNVTWQLNSGATIVNLTYNESIVSEFETIGLIRRPSRVGGGGGAGGAGNIILSDLKIQPELVSVLY